jgi:hypothetical protein
VGLFFLSFGAWWWRSGQAAGDVLLDCGPAPYQKPQLLPSWQLQLHIPLEHKQVVAALLKEKLLVAQLKERWPVVGPDY